MRIGFFSPLWPPNHGGVSIYNHQLALTLKSLGHEVSVFTSSAHQDNKNNGAFIAVRNEKNHFEKKSWLDVINKQNNESKASLFAHYELMNAAHEWALNHHLEMLLVSVPFQETAYFHARELYRSLQACGIKVGALHYDIAPQILQLLTQLYVQEQKTWEQAAQKVEKIIRANQNHRPPIELFHSIGSPFFFEPDFVISTSHWSERFIASPSKELSFVCHPIIDPNYWQSSPTNNLLDVRDILMVNPQSRKAPKIMLNLIEDSNHETFRILEGGWGESFKKFIPLLNQTKAYQQGRVETHEYIEDIRSAYQSSRAVFFPSFVEGYGMTGIEPMYRGTPVISSNYPAILEAVGNSAYLLCPYRSNRKQWQVAMNEVLQNQTHWQEKSLRRAIELQTRQNQEIRQLKKFLESHS